VIDIALLLAAGLTLGGAVVVVRLLDGTTWRRQLLAYRLRLPRELEADDVSRWLATVVAGGGSRRRLLDAPPIGLETIARSGSIETFLIIPVPRESAVLASLRAALPGVRVEPKPEHLLGQPRWRAAAELRQTSLTRPLGHQRAEATVAAFLASLQPLPASSEVRTQWLFTGSRTPHPSTLPTEPDGNLMLLAYASNRDVEAIRAERLKHAEPLMRACCRIGVTASTTGQAAALLDRVVGALRLMDAPGVTLQRRWLPSWWVAEGLTKRALPVLAWPLLLNTREAAGLVGLPIGDVHLPGVRLGSARQLPPSPGMPSRGTVIGLSNYPGMEARPLALTSLDRLRHTWVVGPTGVGKSTLLGNLIVQDMQRGDAVIVIDARGDLIPDILNRVPQGRYDEVIVLDPANMANPVGFNVLQTSLGQPELAVDHVLHVLHELFRSSWGPRTADVLRAGLLTLVHTKAADGSVFTIVELPTLLTNALFRRSVISQISVPVGLRDFWQWYENLSDAERASVIGPVLNKLRGFVLREPLRLLLGQSDGLNLTTIFTERRILLVPLSRGTLGAETTQLVGSLLMASLWQTTLARVAVPAERRRPVWLYVDEFQETVRLPLDLADMLSQARGLGLGLTLAHQYLGQLPDSAKTAVLGTARTHIAFQCAYDDATTLARSFAPLTRDDLMGLETYEIALRPSVGGRTASAVTATTLPLPTATSDGQKLAANSRARYGVSATQVDAAIAKRIEPPASGTTRIGRVDRGGIDVNNKSNEQGDLRKDGE
jgi:hypothetical protein